jgi:hypothetical protein
MRWIVFACAVAMSLAARAAVVEIEAGPLWNNMDAQNKCPNVCSQRGAEKWTGEWRTTQMGRMSVCSCDFRGPGPQGGSRPGAVAVQNACSVGGTAKCPGCSVSCEPGRAPVCSPPVEGFNVSCMRDASCRCEIR